MRSQLVPNSVETKHKSGDGLFKQINKVRTRAMKAQTMPGLIKVISS